MSVSNNTFFTFFLFLVNWKRLVIIFPYVSCKIINMPDVSLKQNVNFCKEKCSCLDNVSYFNLYNHMYNCTSSPASVLLRVGNNSQMMAEPKSFRYFICFQTDSVSPTLSSDCIIYSHRSCYGNSCI